MITLPINYKNSHWIVRKKARKQYAIKQDGLCYHCKEPLNGEPSCEIMDKDIDYSLFPIGMFDYPIHLHHDHKTGMTIGAVHCLCNAVLWQFHGE